MSTDMCHPASLRKGLRILVVDPTADSRDLLTAVFEEYGVETITAACVSEALEYLQQTRPDLLISEILLPGEDGYSLIRRVRALETTHLPPIPALALTVCARESDRIRALATGFCRHLSKPFDIDELIATVAMITGQTQEIPADARQ